MKLSVIVTVYNRFNYVENILKCLMKQTVMPYEVIFTDDGSKEDLKELLKQYKEKVSFKMKHIYQEDLGFRKSRACNNAVIESEGDYLVFLDQDAVFPEDLLENFVQRQKEKYFSILRVIWTEHDEMLAIQKRIDKGENYEEYLKVLAPQQFKALKRWLWKDAYNNLRYRFKLRDRGTGLMGIGFGVSKKDMLAINGYDEDFEGWGGEDADLGLRLYYLGVRSLCFSTKQPAMHMCHPLDPTKVNNKDNNKKLYEEKKTKILDGECRCNYGIDKRKEKDAYRYAEI